MAACSEMPVTSQAMADDKLDSVVDQVSIKCKTAGFVIGMLPPNISWLLPRLCFPLSGDLAAVLLVAQLSYRRTMSQCCKCTTPWLLAAPLSSSRPSPAATLCLAVLLTAVAVSPAACWQCPSAWPADMAEE